MKKKDEIQEELTKLSPFLAQIKKENKTGFENPENYFALLEASVMEQVKFEPTSLISTNNKSSLSWWTIFYRPQLIGSLAVFSCLLVLGIFLINQSEEIQPTLADITSTEATIYISEHLEDFETDLFVDERIIEELIDTEFNEQELEQYLEGVIDELDEIALEELL